MDPEQIASILERANELLEAGKAADTLACLDQIKDQLLDAEDRIEWTTLQAWALSELGRDEEALKLLEAIIAEVPPSSRLYGTLGVVFSNADDLGAARAALEQAVALNENDEVALANLALVYEKMREYEAAIRLYDRSIELGADLDWALQRKAAAQIEISDYDGAKASLRRYLSLAPDDIAQWIELAILHSEDEEYAEAFACYQSAERIDPNSPSLRLNWGVTAVRAGHAQAAHQQLRLLQQAAPDSSRWWLLRAFILEDERGNDPAVRECYEQALQRVPPDSHEELTYALEMKMDFLSRHKQNGACEKLLREAYAANACSVALCEAYREAVAEPTPHLSWFSLMAEADYRAGLSEVHERGANGDHARFLRNYQVVASDRDDAVGQVLAFLRRMGETRVRIREFVGEETLDNACPGIYEIEKDSLVLGE